MSPELAGGFFLDHQGSPVGFINYNFCFVIPELALIFLYIVFNYHRLVFTAVILLLILYKNLTFYFFSSIILFIIVIHFYIINYITNKPHRTMLFFV